MDFEKVSQALDRAAVTAYNKYMTNQRLTTFDINTRESCAVHTLEAHDVKEHLNEFSSGAT